MPKNKPGFFLPLAIFFVFLVILAIAPLWFYIIQYKINKPEPSEAPKINVELVGPPETTSTDEETNVPNQKKYTSVALGISFLYLLSDESTQQFLVKESGNKIWIYSADSKPEAGQYIEVFKKDKSETLSEAIKKQFLNGYLEKDCFVKEPASYRNVTNFKTAEISYPPPEDSASPFWLNAEKCPPKYTTTNGVSYFVMDTNHPDKFAYISIGQYGIFADDKKLWQDTITFK